LTRSNPTVARRQLSVLLKDARERSGRSLDDLAQFLAVSAPQASRLDSGVRGFRTDDVDRLADWYGLDDVEKQRLLALSAESRRREWWQQVDLDDAYRALIGMEQAAQSIAEYGGSVLPGLLQTRAYAHAVASVIHPEIGPDIGPEEIDQAVEVRMRRQRILDRDRPPRLEIVIDELVLARGVHGGGVMREQLEHLLRMTDKINISVQVVGFEFGLHPGLNSHFILLTMAAGLPDFLYSEGLRGSVASSDDDVLVRYRRAWTELRGIALDPVASRARIDGYLRRLSP